MKKLLLTIALILGFGVIVPVYAGGNYYQMDGKPHNVLPNQWINFYVPVQANGDKVDTKHFICGVTTSYQDNIKILYKAILYTPNDSTANGGNISWQGNIVAFTNQFDIKSMGGKLGDPYRLPFVNIGNFGCNPLDKNCNKNNFKNPKITISCDVVG